MATEQNTFDKRQEVLSPGPRVILQASYVQHM